MRANYTRTRAAPSHSTISATSLGILRPHGTPRNVNTRSFRALSAVGGDGQYPSPSQVILSFFFYYYYCFVPSYYFYCIYALYVHIIYSYMRVGIIRARARTRHTHTRSRPNLNTRVLFLLSVTIRRVVSRVPPRVLSSVCVWVSECLLCACGVTTIFRYVQ